MQYVEEANDVVLSSSQSNKMMTYSFVCHRSPMHPPMHPIDASGERSPDSSLSGGGETALPPLLFFFPGNGSFLQTKSGT